MNWYIKKFNELNINELYEILKQRINVFVVEQNCPYLECDEKDKFSYHLFIKNKNSEIIGYLRIINPGISYKEVSIGRVLVKKDYRKKGIARKLVSKALNFIHHEMKQNTIRISAQKHLVNFYQSLGFKSMSEVYLEDNIPHVEMLCIFS